MPVVAAKPEPAKEKPANPGGLEVPDQNKQVLAARNAPAADSRPAQVVNQTEQPVDLNQIARRDSVRVVWRPAPSSSPRAPAIRRAGCQPTPATAPAPGEPRRVQSVRIADPVAPPPAVTPVTPPPSAAPRSVPVHSWRSEQALPLPVAPRRPRQRLRLFRQADRPQSGPSRQSRHRQRFRRRRTAGSSRTAEGGNAPAIARDAAASGRECQPATAPAANNNNGPLPLSNPSRPATPPAAAPANPAPRVATAPAAGGGGAFAIQLASRPSEADARMRAPAGQRFSGQIGGKAPVVVRGEANGQTVYRVRVTGFAQADATAACDKHSCSGRRLLRDAPVTAMKPLIFGAAGPRLTNSETAFYAEHKPAGFILFRRNIEDPAQVKALVASMKEASGNPDALVLIDQEAVASRGFVRRIGQATPPVLPMARSGASTRISRAKRPFLARGSLRMTSPSSASMSIACPCSMCLCPARMM